MRARPIALAVALAGVLLTAACTAASGSGSSAAAGGSAAVGAARAAAPRSTSSAVAQRLAPALIVTASQSVTVADVNSAANAAEGFAADAGGRTDADDRQSTHGGRPTAQLTLRVPNRAVPSVLTECARLGRQTTRHLSTRDVTTDVADVDSRVASARAAIDALRTLYRRTVKVGDIIRVETTLSQRETALESLEAQQRALDAQVALATIDVQLTRRAAAPPSPPPAGRGGFVGGIENGWDAFVTTVVAVATGLGAALPFIIVVGLVSASVLVFRRRKARSTASGVE